MHNYKASIEQRLVALESSQCAILARLVLLEQARYAAPLEPDSLDSWFAHEQKVDGSMKTQEHVQSPLSNNESLLSVEGETHEHAESDSLLSEKGSMRTQEHAGSLLLTIPVRPSVLGRWQDEVAPLQATSATKGIAPPVEHLAVDESTRNWADITDADQAGERHHSVAMCV